MRYNDKERELRNFLSTLHQGILTLMVKRKCSMVPFNNRGRY